MQNILAILSIVAMAAAGPVTNPEKDSKPGSAGDICDGGRVTCQPPTTCTFAGCFPGGGPTLVCPPHTCACP
ncbi:hypothetical protein CLAFUW4_20071 [Fulvia fulva]|uniref:uncharacterized protein n=1 Tax=Passalora fulva TaxID=5499 RepID=UPI002852760B|nr:uncharacterized protein CLAFUR5_20071 [Fulvia fulva]KAK4618164.1 hypothetical protein CLAFUR4_20071 [Fulvia fulva]KAK4618633.1 hypothetical protein CLAFUR0_20071 [Fulvia fulva]WMI38978.1 hypothetical protein CLAFUR5_20071 [Fulvia fulva]WPV18349.1 hypothetical protein CLAFUW4_20071 [Fulvia fulva]WPV33156.1 hypothetical protein CLAFUW7_20071 [Fulvia fulva]